MDLRFGRVRWGPQGTRRRTKTWNQPLRWQREALAAGVRRKVFAFSLADVFEDYRGPDPAGGLQPWRADLFRLIDRCTALDWLLLTKRPERVRGMWEGPPRQNVWLGTSLANQDDADKEVPRLLGCAGLGALLFLSIEPQIGPITLRRFLVPTPLVQWVIVGGESRQGGPPRPFRLDWARALRDECAAAGVPFFFKQAGADPHEGVDDEDGRVRRLVPLRLADAHGGTLAELPADLRVRQCPETFYPRPLSA